MRVRMKSTTFAGPCGCFPPGAVADLETGLAYTLCENGYAEQVDFEAPAAEAEQACVAPPETAVLPQKRRGRKKAC